MKQKLLSLFVALVATTALWASNTITYTSTLKLYGHYTLEVGDNTFGPAIIDHSFSNGIGTITCAGEITKIGSYAFHFCGVMISIDIPNSVTTIEDGAFEGCTGMTSLVIPNSVTTIERFAFNDVNNIIYNGTATGSPWGAKCVNGYVDGYLVYSDATKTTLCGCSSAATGEIVIPNSVTTIGNNAFLWCSGLTSITIPNSVTTIGIYAFASCKGLTSVTIPNSVTAIGARAFSECTSLTSIICYAATPPTCGDECFNEVKRSIPVYVPSRSLSAYQSAREWEDFTNLQANPNVYVAVECDSTKGTVTGAGNYKIGDQCTISVTPYDHFHFVQWNDGNKTNPRTFVVTQDTSFTAQIDEDVFTLTAQSDDNTKGTVSGGGTYPYGTQVQLTATSNDHCYFVQWSDGVKTNPRTVTVVGDATYTAHFSIDQYTITATTTNGVVTGSGTYDYGTEAALTVIPNVGYEFTTWSDGNTDNPRIVSVTEDATYNCICTQMTAGKCGNNLYWEYKEGKLIITGTGEMYDYAANEMPWYLYRDNVQHVEFSAGLTYIGCNAFTNFIRIEEITCFANQSPRVCSTTFDGLSKQYIYLYVPADYIRSYQLNPSWNEFDIRTKSADVTPLNNDKPAVSPTDNDVTITWPINNDAETYTLTITKNGETVCVLTFNSNGQLINIAFAAPGHNGAHQAPAATLTAQGYQFTVTGLNPGTSYNYSVIATNAGGKTIAKHKGEFSTTGGTGFETVHGSQCTIHKVLRNGQILLERNNATYTLTGQKVL